MRRDQLEHLIRAAAAVTNEAEIVVLGSQSILGALPNAPEIFLVSDEADLYPLHRPELAELIEGSLGELSLFHEQFGYYAQGVGPETAVLPAGWQQRLVRVQSHATGDSVGHCLDLHDLAASKLAAAREKDRDFVSAMLEYGFIQMDLLVERIMAMPLPPDRRRELQTMAEGLATLSPPSSDVTQGPTL
jgi:hypothetical protein